LLLHDERKHRSYKIENGLTILTEKMPDVRSATLGFWIKRGSRHEPANLNGISHFIEHAVFKGTSKRTALDMRLKRTGLAEISTLLRCTKPWDLWQKSLTRKLPKLLT
jgi:predicted Zn-dependent peptidase